LGSRERINSAEYQEPLAWLEDDNIAYKTKASLKPDEILLTCHLRRDKTGFPWRAQQSNYFHQLLKHIVTQFVLTGILV